MPPPHKVVLRYQAVRANDPASGRQIDPEMARRMNLTQAMELSVRINEWLIRTDSINHVINAYDNTDDHLGLGEIVVVLDDLDTALLLRLAM